MSEARVVDLCYELFRKASDAEDRGHLDTAVRVYTQAARMGYDIAMTNLATLLDDHVIPRDPTGAIYWYIRAFRAGHDSAAWNLAMHYIPRNNQRWYRFWMLKAESLGHEDAIVEMAKIRADPNYMTRLPLED